MSEPENEGKQGVYVYANLIDANGDGKIDMISFVDPNEVGALYTTGGRLPSMADLPR